MSPSRDQLVAAAVVAAVGCGMMAGLLFVFSNVIMRALLQQPAESGMRTMQAINAGIQNPVFFALFFGTAALTAGLAVATAGHSRRPGATLLLAGSVCYLIGAFVVTVAGNVPLNDGLARHAAAAADAEQYWRGYAARWLMWNHLRTAAAMLAAGLLAWGATAVARAPEPWG